MDDIEAHIYLFTSYTTVYLSPDPADFYRAGVYVLVSQAWCVLELKSPQYTLIPSSPSNLLKDDNPANIEFRVSFGAPVNIWELNAFL